MFFKLFDFLRVHQELEKINPSLNNCLDIAAIKNNVQELNGRIEEQLSAIYHSPSTADRIVNNSEVGRNKIFVSYSHKDKDSNALERIQTHLKVMENEGISINSWDDTQIKAGMNWREEIEKALEATKVAILLVSTDFLASDFINKIELPRLLKAAENDGATILPLILKPCRFTKNKELSEFQAVNDPLKPLSKLTEAEQDEILLALTDRIEELLRE